MAANFITLQCDLKQSKSDTNTCFFLIWFCKTKTSDLNYKIFSFKIVKIYNSFII